MKLSKICTGILAFIGSVGNAGAHHIQGADDFADNTAMEQNIKYFKHFTNQVDILSVELLPEYPFNICDQNGFALTERKVKSAIHKFAKQYSTIAKEYIKNPQKQNIIDKLCAMIAKICPTLGAMSQNYEDSLENIDENVSPDLIAYIKSFAVFIGIDKGQDICRKLAAGPCFKYVGVVDETDCEVLRGENVVFELAGNVDKVVSVIMDDGDVS